MSDIRIPAVAADGTIRLDEYIIVPSARFNIDAIDPPTVNNHLGDGYDVGSFWIDTATDTAYVCTASSTSSATWVSITAGSGGAVVWGNITGTLSNQTDLQLELDDKLEDAPSDGSTYGRNNGAWVVTTGSGDVSGPASSTDDNFALFDGTTGKLLKDTGVSASDFATSAQGTLADSAVQPGDNVSDLTNDAGYLTSIPGTYLQSGDNVSELTNDAGYTTNLGDVVGPASAVDARLATFDGVTGKLLQDSGSSVSDFATAAQGTLADSALQSGDNVSELTNDAGYLGDAPSDGTIYGRQNGSWVDAGGGSGDVSGPASSVDDRIATFDGTTGKLIQDSGTLISDLATSAQGALADSALQSGDNVSELTNDAGYTTNTGTVTSVSGGTALTNSGTATDPVLDLDNTAVTPGAYTSADITIDAQGRITAAASGSSGSGDVVGPASSVDDRIATFDGTTGKLIQDSGSSVSDFATAAQGVLADSAMQDFSDDTSPTAGGDIDMDGNSIVSTSNADISITPDGTGNINLGTWEIDADQTLGAGQDGYVATYDNSTGLVSFEAGGGGGGGNNWLTANNGSDFSTAPTATGTNAIALGNNATTSSSLLSVAIGADSAATQHNNTALGRQAGATGNSRATAIGYNSTASGNLSTALGGNSTAAGVASVAINGGVDGNFSYAIGNTSLAGDESVAIGSGSQDISSSGNRNVMIGKFAIHEASSAGDSIAIGYNARIKPGATVGSIAIGNQVENNSGGFRAGNSTTNIMHLKDAGNLTLEGSAAQFVLPSYTVATLPTGTTGGMILVTDETGGAVPAFYDGSDWRRVTDRAVVS